MDGIILLKRSPTPSYMLQGRTVAQRSCAPAWVPGSHCGVYMLHGHCDFTLLPQPIRWSTRECCLIYSWPVGTEVGVRVVLHPAVEDPCESGRLPAPCWQIPLQDEHQH